MDSTGVLGFVAGAALIGALFGLSVVGALLFVAFRRLDALRNRNDRLEDLIKTLETNTKAIEPTKAALDDEGDFQHVLLSTDDLLSYVGRKSPGALQQLWEKHAPHKFLNGRRVN